jgi:hypothetical protein
MTHDIENDDDIEDKQGESKKITQVCPREAKKMIKRANSNKYDEGETGRREKKKTNEAPNECQ